MSYLVHNILRKLDNKQKTNTGKIQNIIIIYKMTEACKGIEMTYAKQSI